MLAGEQRQGSTARRRAWPHGACTVVERFPQRLRDRRFWITQALVLGISAAHTSLEATRHLGLLPDLALLPVSTYFIPVVYAALNFGVEGAVPTALWCALLSIPNLILWHSGAQRPGVLLQLALLVLLAYVIARRVDVETDAKSRAQAANARLARLNRTAAASARSLDLEGVLNQTVQAIPDPERRQRAWVLLLRDGTGDELVRSNATTAASEVDADDLAASRNLLALLHSGGADEAVLIDHAELAIEPLHVADHIVGIVGLASGDKLVGEDRRLLEAVANQLSVALGNIRHFRQAETMVNELSRAQAALEEYVRLATEAQEEERKRLARELHDDTIQMLLVAKAELDALASEARQADTAHQRLKRVEQTLADAVDSVRRFSRDLRPSLLDDLGLLHAIDWLVADLGARTGIAAQLLTSGSARRLEPQAELALFRILQEALHNVERHAAASAVRVHLTFTEPQVCATVVDDGSGFDPQALLEEGDPSVKLGLLGMRERAKLAGAELTLRSRPGTGTSVTVTLATSD